MSVVDNEVRTIIRYFMNKARDYLLVHDKEALDANRPKKKRKLSINIDRTSINPISNVSNLNISGLPFRPNGVKESAVQNDTQSLFSHES